MARNKEIAMSSNLGINPDELAAANEALTDFVNQEPAFYNTAENCRALQQWLKTEKVPLSRWHVKAFALAYWHCTRADAKFPLTPIPPKETEQQRIERLHARDRGGYTGERHQSRMAKSSEGSRTVSEYEKQCAAAEAKRTADADVSKVPSIESLIAGDVPMFNSLGVTEAMKLSLQQAKLYSKHSAEAAWEIQRRRSEAKLARMKEQGKS
jgi:hypothetical protein